MTGKLNKYLLAFTLLFISVAGHTQVDVGLENTLQAVNPNDIKASMTFLSDDLLEGRQPGTRGFAIASKYVETRFISLGLQPGVNGKSYTQPVPFRKGIVDETNSSFTISSKEKSETLTLGKDFILTPYFLSPSSEVTAPLVFVGFGVSAPELGYDDYEKINVKGKIVVYLNGAPSDFPSNERAYFSSSSKLNEAVSRGAIGVVSFSPPGDNRSSWEAAVRRSKQGSFKWLKPDNNPANSTDELKAVASFNPESAEKLFASSGKTIQSVFENAKAGNPQAFPLNISASIKVKTHTVLCKGPILLEYYQDLIPS